MADHSLEFALWYDGTWNPAPVYVRGGCTAMRGIKRAGDSDPSTAALTLDNRSGKYAPRSVASPLFGKIGQNTRCRLTIDGSVRMVGEVTSWTPGRSVDGNDAWTVLEIAGVLQRIGRGTEAIQGALTRAVLADGPVAYWPLTDPAGSTAAVSGLSGGAPMTINGEGTGTIVFAAVDGPIGGDDQYPQFIQAGAYTPRLVGAVPAPAATPALWQFEGWFNCRTLLTAGIDGLAFDVVLTGNGVAARMSIILQGEGRLTVYYKDAADTIVYAEATALGLAVTDGRWHQVRVVATQTGATWKSEAYFDGALYWTDTGIAGGIGFPTTVYTAGHWDPFGITIPDSLSTGHIAVGTVNADHYAAGYGHAGELADTRFGRLGAQQAITTTVVGVAGETVAMGPQLPLTALGEFDEVARTDDASIFETRGSVGLTMRTGASKLNQTPGLTISYVGQVRPPLAPVTGDDWIRNDVIGSNPAGATARVQQLTGPYNVQTPDVDPQGVGRYGPRRVDVNPSTVAGVADAAGWSVNHGTYTGTWYAEITADLDAAPGITAAAAALDIGDVIAVSNLPVDDAADTVECLIIGILEDCLPKRRTITFYCVPASPYRVGKLAATVGDVDPVVGHLESDGASTVGAVAAGAGSFPVGIPAGPIWTIDPDDFPQDVIVGGQRVTLASVASYLNANPLFETNAASWTPGGATFVRSTAQQHEGAASGLLTPNGVAATPQLESELVPAVPGRLYVCSAWIRCTAARSIDLYVGFYDAAAGLLSATGATVALAANTWTAIQTSSTAPVGTTQVRAVFFEGGTPPVTDVLYIDEAYVVSPVQQVFRVDPAGRQVRYPVAAGSAVTVQQPVILSL